jgi:hypothetical protein
VTDPTRCQYCGVALLDNGPHTTAHFVELDTGEHHDSARCRDYLFAEVERLRRKPCFRCAYLELFNAPKDAKPLTEREMKAVQAYVSAKYDLDAARAELERTRTMLANVDDKLKHSLDCETELEARGLVLLALAAIHDAQALLREKGDG